MKVLISIVIGLLVMGCGQSVAELKKALPDCNIQLQHDPQQASGSLVLPVEVPERLWRPKFGFALQFFT